MRVLMFGFLFLIAAAFVAVMVVGVAIRVVVFAAVLIALLMGAGWLVRKFGGGERTQP